MSYVLVSLRGDEATQMNDAFAQHFAKAFPPAVFFSEEHPDHDRVAESVRAWGQAVVMGHDGAGSLRAHGQGPPWTDARGFASMFRGARVWAYACDTRGASLETDLDSFGRQAVELGVRVFAGHAAPITAPPPFATMPTLRDEVYRALGRGFRCFLQGSNNADEIRLAALRNRSAKNALIAYPIQDALASLRVCVAPR